MKKFTNTTNKDFTCSWNGVERTFLPGEYAILEDGIAQTFAKHLANVYFGGTVVANDERFIKEMNKYLSDAVEEVKTEEFVEQILLEVEKEPQPEVEVEIEEEKEEPKKKGRKSKKVSEFEGIDAVNETNI